MKELDGASDRSKRIYAKNKNLLGWMTKQLRKIAKSGDRSVPNATNAMNVEQTAEEFLSWLEKSIDVISEKP